MNKPENFHSRGPVLLFLFFLPFLQGCTLLFVEKGETRYVENKTAETPLTPPLAKKLAAPVVLKYRVQEEDTLESVALIYYGHASKAGKVAAANHLSLDAGLRKGMVLRIPDPVNFPNPKDLVKKKKKKGPAEKDEDASPVSHRDTTPEKITRIRRPAANHAFSPGEKLRFEVRALSMVGGYGTLEVGSPVTVKGRSCYPLTAHAATAFPFSAVYQVKDVQTSYFDASDFITWKFENKVLEGKHQGENMELYDQLRHTVVRSQDAKPPEEMDVAPFTQDIISCFYYFRMLPMKVGENYSIPTQAAGKNYNLIVEVIRKEKVTIASGTYDCLLVKPHVRYATVFRNTDDIEIWLTDDQRRLPVLVRSAIFIGHVEATLLDATLPQLNPATPGSSKP